MTHTVVRYEPAAGQVAGLRLGHRRLAVCWAAVGRRWMHSLEIQFLRTPVKRKDGKALKSDETVATAWRVRPKDVSCPESTRRRTRPRNLQPLAQRPGKR